jgi:hypothetical protein
VSSIITQYQQHKEQYELIVLSLIMRQTATERIAKAIMGLSPDDFEGERRKIFGIIYLHFTKELPFRKSSLMNSDEVPLELKAYIEKAFEHDSYSMVNLERYIDLLHAINKAVSYLVYAQEIIDLFSTESIVNEVTKLTEQVESLTPQWIAKEVNQGKNMPTLIEEFVEEFEKPYVPGRS